MSQSDGSDSDEVRQSIRQVRIQTAKWLKQRSANVASVLSARNRLRGNSALPSHVSRSSSNGFNSYNDTISTGFVINSFIKDNNNNDNRDNSKNKDNRNDRNITTISIYNTEIAKSKSHHCGFSINNNNTATTTTTTTNNNNYNKENQKHDNNIPAIVCNAFLNNINDNINNTEELCPNTDLFSNGVMKLPRRNNNNNNNNNNNSDDNSKQKTSRSASLMPGLRASSKPPFAVSKFQDANCPVKANRLSLQLRKKSVYQSMVGSEGCENMSADLELRARQEAEKAMKSKKIFTVIGPYPSLRLSLRRRGWVEKLPSMASKNEGLDGFSDYLSDEKNPALITMMSQVVRNCMPSLIFSVKAVDVGSHATRNNQFVNHFARSSTFTTKVGLCHNLKYVPWFVLCDPNTFYPRCYNLANQEEKDAFRDDFRLMACCALLKCYLMKRNNVEVVMGRSSSSRRSIQVSSAFLSSRQSSKSSTQLLVPTLRVVSGYRASHTLRVEPIGNDLTCTRSPDPPSEAILGEILNEQINTNERDNHSNNNTPVKDNSLCIQNDNNINNIDTTTLQDPDSTIKLELSLDDAATPIGIKMTRGSNCKPEHCITKSKNSNSALPIRALYFAIERCKGFVRFKENEDIDCPDFPHYDASNGSRNSKNDNNFMKNDSSVDWPEFLACASAYVKGEKEIEPCSTISYSCRDVLIQMRKYCPQFEMEGFCNVWILKPGAKSRGRGIQCLDNYNEIMATASSADSACVVQKYIERPLLIYKTKFDIRQWFLVTDWNLLTIWFYMDCYLRFCSQEFTLDDFHVSVHLSNNSVQKHFTPSAGRSKNIPEDNMWTSDQFQEYLKRNGHGRVWTEYIVPEMKQAILCSLLCTQEHIECRKGAFELYGADFMLTEDLKPWLLEINSSPSMAKNTQATSILVDQVMEDMLKVVLDRKVDKNCDTGRFELIYKQTSTPPLPNPSIDLTVQGKKIRRSVLKR